MKKDNRNTQTAKLVHFLGKLQKKGRPVWFYSIPQRMEGPIFYRVVCDTTTARHIKRKFPDAHMMVDVIESTFYHC